MHRTAVAIVALGLAASAAHAQESALALSADEAAAVCREAGVRDLCLATCAQACRLGSFLEANVDYCLGRGLLGTDPGAPAPADAPACAGLLAGLTGRATPDAAPEAAAPEGSDCESFATLSERRRCALAKVTPKCSATVTELESDARLLVDEITRELAQYGDLLERDWNDISNRQRLCVFSLAELDASYEAANDNPEILRALQQNASEIQACQSDWEDWVRSNAGTRASDSLIDQVSRDAEAQLGPLKAQVATLSQSVARLESAAATIVEIVDIHIIYCDPAGSPPDATDG